ncbi:MAG: CehA/McbA family metallohydrolase [Planctomycetota bacterium]
MLGRVIAGIAAALLLPVTLADIEVTDRGHHLGDSDVQGWNEAHEPEGERLEVTFQARAGAASIELGQRDVSDEWRVSINGKTVGLLERTKGQFTHYLDVAQGVLLDGENTLTVAPRAVGDDIVVGPIRLIESPLGEVLHLGQVVVKVSDADSKCPVPARITVATPEGKLVALYNAAQGLTAVRIGTMYTLGAGDAFEVPEGEYVVYATRGMEWGMPQASVRVARGSEQVVELSIAREVDTTGFIAADTHIHTYTYSGHGNATIWERMITLAGEGVELAIATDHNHQTDYSPVQDELEVNPFFRAVTGNEVTTKNGHFNAFPMDPDGALPDHTLKDWVKLVEDIRAKGARVVILNHPHWPDFDRGPFGVHGFEPSTGDRASGTRYTFDCLELVNSTTDEPDPLAILADWMALLNRGERLTAIGSSDSHTVDDPVGQGRTYVRCSDDEPSEIDVDEACEAFLRGDVSVSLGIFADVEVDGKRMGDLVAVRKRPRIELALRIAAPGWIRPRRVVVFLNGEIVHDNAVSTPEKGPVDLRLKLPIEVSRGDAHLVCAAVGDGVKMPGWPTLNGYTLAVTNPVFLDVDGDGKYASPRDQARSALDGLEIDPEKIVVACRAEGEAVGLQMLSVLHEERGFDLATLPIDPDAGFPAEPMRRYIEWIRQAAKHGHSH